MFICKINNIIIYISINVNIFNIYIYACVCVYIYIIHIDSTHICSVNKNFYFGCD